MRIYCKSVDVGLNSAQLHDAAYALLREALQADWGLDAVEIEKTEAGKPVLAGGGPEISVSHTAGLVCCAVSRTPVGVDCEHPRTVSARMMQHVCTEKELADIRRAEKPAERFLMYWTLKESIAKKRGVGLRESFQQYEITVRDGVPLCAGHTLHFEYVDGFFVAAAE